LYRKAKWIANTQIKQVACQQTAADRNRTPDEILLEQEGPAKGNPDPPTLSSTAQSFSRQSSSVHLGAAYALDREKRIAKSFSDESFNKHLLLAYAKDDRFGKSLVLRILDSKAKE